MPATYPSRPSPAKPRPRRRPALSHPEWRSTQTRDKLPLVAQASYPGLISRKPYESRPRPCKVSLLDCRADNPLKLTGEDAGPSAPSGPPRQQGLHALKLPIETDETIQSCPTDLEFPSDVRNVAGREASMMTPQQLADGLVPPVSLCPDSRLDTVLVIGSVVLHSLLRATSVRRRG